MIMPLQTAGCERGFSAQNGIKTARRNRLGEETMNILMNIKCEGDSVDKEDFSDAISIWKGKKERRCVNLKEALTCSGKRTIADKCKFSFFCLS